MGHIRPGEFTWAIWIRLTGSVGSQTAFYNPLAFTLTTAGVLSVRNIFAEPDNRKILALRVYEGPEVESA